MSVQTLQNAPQSSINQLQKYLEAEKQQHQREAFKYVVIANTLLFVGIIASVLASIFAATEQPYGTMVGAVLAAVPAAVVLLTNTFKPDDRARWHKLKQRKLESLHRDLVFEGEDSKVVSERLSIMLEELEQTRIGLGQPKI